jgi:hypothetical protein
MPRMGHAYRMRIAGLLLAWLAAALPLSGIAAAGDAAPSPLLNLPEGRWVKIHQQQPGDAVTFERQRHGGSTFDTRRGQLLLFGSDTHDVPPERWLNTPLIFDLASLQWRQAYKPDPVSSYRVDGAGLPVAGPAGDHPWAMHTFGAVTYDPAADAVVVSSFPDHLEPGRFTDAVAAPWAQIKRHPTWVWHPATGRWEALPGVAVAFFANATTYDSPNQRILGYRSDGIYALDAAAGAWRIIVNGGLLEWGSNVVFDEAHGVLIAYGSHRGENDVVVFDPATGLHRKMPTPGGRPPGAAYVPMAFHAGIGQTVALLSRPPTQAAPPGTTETWLYDYARDRWTHRESADMPFQIGMNYNLAYDPGYALLLLVATPPDTALPAVWALNLGGSP